MVNIEIDVNYRIVNLEAGTYLTLSSVDNVSLVGQPYTVGANQVWLFESAGRDNVYFAKSVETNQYLAVPSGQIVEGQQLKANFAPFEWQAVNEPNVGIGARFVPASNTDLYIDLWEGSANPGTIVQLFPKTGNNQVWVLEKIR